jgi:peptidoglycan/LPS O-acetylase OafA/YrhL
MRAVAAMIVMLGHVRGLFFVDLSNIAWHPNILLTILYATANLGYESVMIFFVLSGFLIGGEVLRRWLNNEWSWTDYAVNRLTRLWVVLIPALILGSMWDHLGIFVFGKSGIYGGYGTGVDLYDVSARLSLRTMLGNAAFLQMILVTPLGSNGALWSLTNEFWYYLLFPLVVLAYPAKKISPQNVLYGCAALIVGYFVGGVISAYFLIWLLGAAINLAPGDSRSRSDEWLLGGVGVCWLLVFVRLVLEPGLTMYSRDLLVGFAAATLILMLVRREAGNAFGVYPRIAHGFAAFSYTLYLVHIPALEFLSAWIVPKQKWQPDALHLAFGAALAAATLGYAYAIASITEHRTLAIRTRLINAIRRESVQSVPIRRHSQVG